MKKVLAKDGLKGSYGMGSLGRITGLDSLPPDRVLPAYTRQAADFVESGQRTKSIDCSSKSAKKPLRVPAELAAALKKNKMARKVCEGFRTSCQREYADRIAEAKLPETKTKRVNRAVDWICPRQTAQLEVHELSKAPGTFA